AVSVPIDSAELGTPDMVMKCELLTPPTTSPTRVKLSWAPAAAALDEPPVGSPSKPLMLTLPKEPESDLTVPPPPVGPLHVCAANFWITAGIRTALKVLKNPFPVTSFR